MQKTTYCIIQLLWIEILKQAKLVYDKGQMPPGILPGEGWVFSKVHNGILFFNDGIFWENERFLYIAFQDGYMYLYNFKILYLKWVHFILCISYLSTV